MDQDDASHGWHYADVWDLIAELRPEQDALVHGDRRISWSAFRDRAGALASSLVEGGAGQGDRVAQYLYNGPEYLEVTYAAYQAGLTPVNTNYRYRSDELAYLWDNADAVAVVFHGTFSETIAAMRDRVPTVRRWLWVDDGTGPCPDWAEPYEAVVATGPVGPYAPPWGRSGDDIVMIYTGGTTGMPKGVMWRHDDMYRSFNAIGDPEERDLGAVRDRLAAGQDPPAAIPGSPLMHATGYMFAKSMLVQGGTVVTLPDRHFDVQSLLATIEREGVTAMAIVGDAFARPILEALDAAPNNWDLSSLQLLVSAGVMWSAETKAGLAHHLPATLFADLLGSTEAHGMGSSVSGAGSDPATAKFSLGAHAMVIDDDGNVVRPGGTGMLAVGGPGPIGYHKDPEKTAATFRTVAGQRVSVPGDWARVEDDGSITLLGRGSLCINTGGEKVFPEEVEEALETHPAVRDSTVVGVPDPAFGEAVGAVVSLAGDDPVTAGELIAHVKGRIAGYKAPRHLLIVDDVERSPNGKADYAGARHRLLDHLSTTSPSELSTHERIPMSPSPAPETTRTRFRHADVIATVRPADTSAVFGRARSALRASGWRLRFAGCVAVVGLLMAVAPSHQAAAQEHQAAAPDSSFGVGSGRASAKYLKVGPSRGSLALAPTVGLALSDFLNTRGRGDVRTVDFAALEDSLPPELVNALPALKVESTDEGSEDGETVALGTPAEVPVGVSAATLRASAGTAPFGRSTFETAPVRLGVVEISGGTAEAYSGILDGNVREAVGTVEIGRVDIGGGALVLEGVRWEAVHRSGAASAEQGTFTVGAVSVAGQRFGAPEGVEQPLADALAAAQPLLGPLGLQITLPTSRIEAGFVEMTPLRIRVANPALGAVVGPVLEGVQPVRDAVVDAIRSGTEDIDVVLLLTDVALGVLAGGSTLDIELGGVTAQTAEPAERFTFGSAGGFNLSAGSPAAPGAAGAASVPSDASPSLGSAPTSSVELPAPLAGAGAGVAADDSATSDIAAGTVPVSSSATGGGAGPLLLIGLAAAAAAVAAGAVDYRRLLRRPLLPA